MTFSVTAVSPFISNVAYSLASGSLPTGLSLSSTGGITGVANLAGGLFSFGVAAADAYTTVGRSFSITVTPRTLTWSQIGNLGTYVQQTALAFPLAAVSSTGNAVSYTLSGSYPTGLSIVANTITGTLPAIGSNTAYSFSVTASDGVVSNTLAASLTSVLVPTNAASNVVCLMHCDDTANGITVGSTQLDQMGHVINVVTTGVTVSTVTSYSGKGSIVFPTTASYFIVKGSAANDFSVGTNPFTIEFALYASGFPTFQWLVQGFSVASGTCSVGLYLSNNNVLIVRSSGNADTSISVAFTAATWYTIAMVRVGTTITLYVNGTKLTPTATIGASIAAISGFCFGADFSGSSGNVTTNGFSGYMDEIRILNGTAQYSANYTPVRSFPNPVMFNSPASAIIGGGPYILNATTGYGAQTLSYALTSGTLPAGLAVNSTSGITGTTTNPASTTNYTFAVTATDGFGTVTATFNAAVLHGVAPVWVTPSGALGTQVQGSNFFAQLNAVANAITLSTSAATTAAGNVLTFAATTGVLIGMNIIGPAIPANTVVSATTATTVTPSQIVPPIPSGTSLNFTPTPVNYTVTSGALPAALALNSSTGVISGLLSAVSSNTTTNFTVTAATAPTLNAAQSFSITTQPIAASDPYIANVVFESDFNGLAGGPLFFDRVGHTVSKVVGVPVLSTASKTGGSSSLYFNGTSAIQYNQNTNEFVFGSGDFTIEFSVNMTSFTGPPQILGVWTTTTAGLSWAVRLSATQIQFFYSTGGGDSPNLVFATSFTTGTWYQIALVRQSGTLSAYVNGTLVGSPTTLPALYAAPYPLTIGYNIFSGLSQMTGYLDAVRISKGVARYSGNYTTSALEFPPVMFITPAGSLGTQAQGSNFAVYVVAQSQFQYPLSYFVSSGALPTGLTLDPATGFIGGVLPAVIADTVSNFIIGASDGTGTALQNFAITTALAVSNDPVPTLVVAEMHFDGVGGTTNFIDLKGHPVQLGASGISTARITNAYRQMGSGALALSGVAATDGLFIGNTAVSYPEYTFSTLDFTIEMSVYFPTVPTATNCPLVAQSTGFGVVYNSNKLYFFAVSPGATVTGASNFTWTPAPSTWYSLAFVRSNGLFTIYVNGTALGAAKALATLTTGAGAPIALGWQSSGTTSLNAMIDELRVTVGAIGSGAARYTANYTPQVQSFSNPYAPVFSVPLASLGTQVQRSAFSASVVAQEGGSGRTITYTVSSGSLPSGVSLSASTGLISGTLPAVIADTTYSFTVTATDNTGLSTTLATAITVAQNNVVAFGTNGVVALMHFDNATTDLKGHVVSTIGTPAFSTTNFLTGFGSLYLSGASALSYANTVQTDWQLTNQDFTIEAAIYLTATPSTSGIVGASSASSQGFLLSANSLAAFGFSYATSATTSTNVAWSFTFALNTWYRLCVVRSGANLYGYVNGVYISTNSIGATSIYNTGAPLFVGFNQSGSSYFQGYIDEIRITKSFARYGAASYSISAQPFDDPNMPYFTANGSLAAQTVGSVVDVFIPAAISNTRTIAAYAIVTGSLLNGLTMNSVTGEIIGTLTSADAATTARFTVGVADNTANTAYQTFSITNLGSP